MVESTVKTINTVAKIVWAGAVIFGIGKAAYESYEGS